MAHLHCNLAEEGRPDCQGGASCEGSPGSTYRQVQDFTACSHYKDAVVSMSFDHCNMGTGLSIPSDGMCLA